MNSVIVRVRGRFRFRVLSKTYSKDALFTNLLASHQHRYVVHLRGGNLVSLTRFSTPLVSWSATGVAMARPAKVAARMVENCILKVEFG